MMAFHVSDEYTYGFNAVLHLDSVAITFAKGERATELEADSTRRAQLTVFPFFFSIAANKRAQMGQNPTWGEIMGEATKGNERKGG